MTDMSPNNLSICSGDSPMVLSSLSDRPITVSAIQRLVPGGPSRNGVKKVLDRLTEQGIVVFDDIGGVSTYALNRDHLLARLHWHLDLLVV